ncbi:ribonuclease III [Calycomorphotria hydatis]|uniref:Ribonuclease 3 n=1 Tax=Calycomorphotria hydatis TaxID=2528027 RepID=A0A517T7E1_9PLAN|nr:ribonuclease III [Calycomorphotria hydatis]QDT64295.1 Ribonuclease 3 [Calycomorphotria hydatis]
MSESGDFDSVEDKLHTCQQVLNYKFQNQQLLRHCLTHASLARTREESNERLEFLGDAILGVIVCELLFHTLPEEPEGELTRLKSVLVSRTTCARVCRERHLDQVLFLGKGLQGTEPIPSSIVGALFEAIVAGLYLDGGMDAARAFVEPVMTAELERVLASDTMKNYKSHLQHIAQTRFGATPTYTLLDESGPDHSKSFQVAAVIGDEQYPPAWGDNKKEAEQAAARNALSILEEEV